MPILVSSCEASNSASFCTCSEILLSITLHVSLSRMLRSFSMLLSVSFTLKSIASQSSVTIRSLKRRNRVDREHWQASRTWYSSILEYSLMVLVSKESFNSLTALLSGQSLWRIVKRVRQLLSGLIKYLWSSVERGCLYLSR
jgi:hypothetical protein